MHQLSVNPTLKGADDGIGVGWKNFMPVATILETIEKSTISPHHCCARWAAIFLSFGVERQMEPRGHRWLITSASIGSHHRVTNGFVRDFATCQSKRGTPHFAKTSTHAPFNTPPFMAVNHALATVTPEYTNCSWQGEQWKDGYWCHSWTDSVVRRQMMSERSMTSSVGWAMSIKYGPKVKNDTPISFLVILESTWIDRWYRSAL